LKIQVLGCDIVMVSWHILEFQRNVMASSNVEKFHIPQDLNHPLLNPLKTDEYVNDIRNFT